MQQSTPIVNLANPKAQKLGGAKKSKWAFQTSGKGKLSAKKAFDAMVSERVKISKASAKGAKTLPSIQKKVNDAANVRSEVVKFQAGEQNPRLSKFANLTDLNNKKTGAKKAEATKKPSDEAKELSPADGAKDKIDPATLQIIASDEVGRALKIDAPAQSESKIANDATLVKSIENVEGSENAKAFGGTKPKVSFLDKDKKVRITDYREHAGEAQKDAADASSKVKILEVKTDENGKSSLTLDLNTASQNAANQNILAANDQSASAAGSNFQAMVTASIVEAAPEFVKAGNIILRDKDEGEIKLVLHPENLGDVKIDLQLHDKAISAKIVVATSEAFGAFKDGSDALKEAFIQSGFESANFDLSFAGGNNQNGANDGRNERAALAKANNAFGGATGGEVDGIEGTLSANFYSNGARRAVNLIA